MDTRRRATGLLLLVGGVALALAVVQGIAAGMGPGYVPWLAASATFLVAALYVWRRLPEHPVTLWFALTAAVFTTTQALESGLARVADGGHEVIAWVATSHQWATILGAIAVAHLLALLPDGRTQRPHERRILASLWPLLALPPAVLVARPTILFPPYVDLPEVANPYHVAGLDAIGTVAAAGVTVAQGAFAVGVVLLAFRYRRADETERRRVRWLLLPTVLATFAVFTDMLAWAVFPEGAATAAAKLTIGALWIFVLVTLPVVIAIALVRPRLLDVDLVIRRSLVYGVLWTLIALTYLGAAAGFGLVAGQRFPVEIAILLAVGATLAFQPARRRLEALADRWVFGQRLGRYEALRHLGRTLEEGFDLADLLPRLAETVRRGLGLAWVRVVVEGDDQGQAELAAVAGDVPDAPRTPSVVVPVVDDGEAMGRIECGATPGRELDDQDHELLSEVARQAGLAMRTLRLTRALSDSVEVLQRRGEELEESRSRLLRVQAVERRRLERDLHDGVQQDVVALIGRVGLARRHLDGDPDTAGSMLAEVQQELGRILGLLREFAHGIHPTVLSDRGLFEALEAQAGRSPLPVSVHGDGSVRTERYREEIEAAAYFTVSEALANVLKHAGASQAEVRLQRRNGALRVEVNDDGCGFDAEAVRGEGLRNLSERLEAIGGRLVVTSGPGRGTAVTAEIAVDGLEPGDG